MSNLREIIPAFFTGPQGQRLTPEQIQAREVIAADMLSQATDTSPNAGGTASIVAKALMGLSAGRNRTSAERAGQANAAASAENMSALTGGIGQGWTMPEASAAPTVVSGLVAPAGTNAGVKPVSSAPLPSISDANDAVFADRHPQSAPSPVPMTKGRQGFIDALLPAAIEHGARIGVDPRIIVAQAAQETGWGRSAPGNNYFGIKSHGKGGGQTFTTHEVINGKRVKIRDSFRQFASPADSVAGYADFLTSNPRYRPMLAAGDLDSQLLELGRSGYATDPNYASSVGAIARSIVLPNPGQSQQTQMPGGAIATPDSSLDPESRARMEGMRQPYDQGNVSPASMPGSVSETPDMVWDDQGFRPNEAMQGGGVQPASLPQGGLPQGATYTPAPAPNPVAQALMMPPIPSVPPLDPRVQQTLASPYATREEKSVAAGLLQQHQSQVQAAQQQYQQRQMAEYEQAVAQQQAAQALAQRQQIAGQMGIDPAYAADEIAFKAMVDQATRDPASYSPGASIRNPDGTWEQIPFAPTGNMQDYDAYATDELRAGRTPLSRLEFEQALRSSGAQKTEVNVNGGEKFDDEFAKLDAQSLNLVSQSGMAAQRNIPRIDRLESLLSGVPTGAEANFKQIAANWGLKLGDDVDQIQAAQALINSMVPEQRPAGSGPMSDADLELFKQSLPRIINTPGGNKLIIDTMRAIAQYDAQGAEIVQRMRNGEINRTQAFQELQSRENPLSGLDGMINGSGDQQSSSVPPPPANANQDLLDVWDIMTPEERAKFQ